VLVTGLASDGAKRTWRPPVTTRIAQVVCLCVLMALPGLWLGLMLVTNQVTDGGWIALALALAAWGLLAWRVLTQSATLTQDTLVIRNILGTEQVPLAGVTEVGFSRGRLTVTAARGAAASERFVVRAVNLDVSRWSGRRSDADVTAQAIAEAAGLPPLPPRREIISRDWAWVIMVAAAVCFGFGAYCGPLRTGSGGLPVALREAGAALYVLGAAMLGLAFRIARDHRRKRAGQRRDA
jgi:hypothetical protein